MKKTTNEQTAVDWRERAAHHALRAHFELRPAAWEPTGDGGHPEVLLISDNEPRPGHESLSRLGWWLVRRWLREQGLTELAFATCPSGRFTSDGTSVMVVRYDQNKHEDLMLELEKVREYVRELQWADYVQSGRILSPGDLA